MASEVEVVAGAIERAATPMHNADTELQAYGQGLVGALTIVAGAAGEGPLARVLGTFGEDAEKRCREKSAECRELS